MSNYCGKNCDTCTYREELSCTGCQSGPGRIAGGDCKLADCCREKGHETCETCELKRNCGKWLDKGSIPKQRMERQQEQREEQALIARRAPFLGKWLWILFWFTIASMVFNYLSGNTVLAAIPALKLPAQAGSYICQIACVCILFVLSKEHYFYKIAAILSGISVIINLFSLVEQLWLLLLIGVIQIAAVLAADYYEYKANAEVVLVIDGRISEQWDSFWIWMMYSSIGLAVSLFLVFLIPALGAITTLVSSVALIVARIKKIMCLYRSAQAFRARTE